MTPVLYTACTSSYHQGARVSHRLEDPASPLVQEEKQLQAVTRLTLASREVNQVAV